jgi:NuA3 HAT complex component NTO1
LTNFDSRLDKDVFKDGLAKLQDKLDERFYTTTLAFAHDLCEVIHVGINAGTRTPADGSPPEALDVSPNKHSTYMETRDRKRLGKRILKSIQQLLQAAVRAEADITNKPVDTLLKELDGMVDASLEIRQPATMTILNEDAAVGEDQDLTMPDVPEEGETIIAHRHAQAAVEAEAEAEADADADADADVDAVDLIKTEPNTDANGDAMDVDPEQAVTEASIEVLRSRAATENPEEATASSSTPPDSHLPPVSEQDPVQKLPNGVAAQDSGSPPPSVDGYSQPAPTHNSSGPLTPPQSNGSLGHGPKEPGDVLSEGGLPWYLTKDDLEVQGTTVVEEQRPRRQGTPPPGQRLMSEELSEMDEETLKDLGIDVNDHTITASPVASETTAPNSARKGRSNPAKFRKGVRSSARRR